MTRSVRCLLIAAGVVSACFVQSANARQNDQVTYLLPAPKEAIVFAPFVLAEQQGKYRRAKLDVEFVVVPGGFNVGKALARGEGDLGGASGDTPILLRASDIPVKGIALLGHHSFLTLITHQEDANAASTASRRLIDVPSLNDTSYYAMQKLTAKMSSTGVNIVTRSRSPADLIAALGTGDLDGFVGTVDWGVKAERSGAQLSYRKLDDFYPAMAQAIMASDTAISKRPDVLRRFVQVTLQSLKRIAADPEGTATAYEAAVPQSGYSHAEIVRVFKLLRSHVYGSARNVGPFDVATVMAAETELLNRNLIANRRPTKDYYSNRFTGR